MAEQAQESGPQAEAAAEVAQPVAAEPARPSLPVKAEPEADMPLAGWALATADDVHCAR